MLRQNGHSHPLKTARTLLKTVIHVDTKNVSGMDYVNLGLEKQILKSINKYTSDMRREIEQLELSFNVDGLPLFKSSGKTLWPVICALLNLKPI